MNHLAPRRASVAVPVLLAFLTLLASTTSAADLGEVPRYHVAELEMRGPELGPTDTPARDVELAVTFRHESGDPVVTVQGFWDGDGRGGDRGSSFKVRFCPSRMGRWTVAETTSNRNELGGQREGDTIECVESDHPGFWLADGGWYARSDGSHPFVVGNTHYSFLSRQSKAGSIDAVVADDVRGNATFYKKLRFALTGDRYPDRALKPFLDEQGRQTDDGRHSQRPNPRWFTERVDPAVSAGFDVDLACDLILCGPDTVEARSTLKGDPRPWLGYVAARYGAYPNVWFCLCNEWNIKDPRHVSRRGLSDDR